MRRRTWLGARTTTPVLAAQVLPDRPDEPGAGRFVRSWWYERGIENANPAANSRFRVNAPEAALHPACGSRPEVRSSGMLHIGMEEDLRLIQGAKLYAEIWGGRPATMHKRLTPNGRTTYWLPEVGTAAGHCTHQYPLVRLKVSGLVPGSNALRFAGDQGPAFRDHFIVDEACVRTILPAALRFVRPPRAVGSSSTRTLPHPVPYTDQDAGEKMRARVRSRITLMLQNILAILLASLIGASSLAAQQPTKQTATPPGKKVAEGAKAPAKSAPVEADAPKGLFPVEVKDKWGYIDGRGKLVITPQFEGAEAFSDDMAAVKVSGGWGFINRAGTLVIPADYKLVQRFAEGFAGVEQESGWGFINKEGKPITTFGFLSVTEFAGGLGWARAEGQDGFVDPEGKHLTFKQFDWVYSLNDGLAPVKVKEKCGFMDRAGTLVIAAELDCKPLEFNGIGGGGGLARMRYLYALSGFSDGMAAFAVDKKWGYIDKTGKTVIAPRFTSKKVTPAVHPFTEGLAGVSVEDKWGFVDKTGKMVVGPAYENEDGPGRFSEGRAAVPVGGKWGYIDKTGKLVVAAQFESGDAFANGLARVWLDGKLCYINKAGNLIWKPKE